MERLSTLDAQFLSTERYDSPMNTAFIALFDRTPPDIFERFKQQVLARLETLPVLSRRLHEPGGWFENPAWSQVEHIDVDYHLRNSALPPPGTAAQLRTLIARLHMGLLDRDKPLWQFYLIEGLDEGGFALYLKLHHSAVDGGAAMLLLDGLFGPAPSLGGSSYEDAPAVARPKNIVESWWESYTEFQRRSAEAWQALPELASTAASAPVLNAPPTPFNVFVSDTRVIGTCSVSFPAAKSAAETLGVKLNDVVLAVCGGALRKYLRERNALPGTDLVAMIPVSLRERENVQMNNQVSMLLCGLGTTVPDTVERTAAIAKTMHAQKAVLSQMKGLLRFGVSTVAPPMPAGTLPDFLPRAPAGTPLPGLGNVVISNVAGPKTHFTLAGATATHYFPVSIAGHGSALNITVQSYAENLEFCLIACHTAVPDVQTICDSIASEFAALQQRLAL